MAQTGSERESRMDLLLGKAALEHGLITPEQLRDALAEQSLGVARGRKLPRPLGVILASRKWVSDAQLADLTRELDLYFRQESEEKQRDVFFGHILVDADLAAQRHVEECLLAQAEMIEQGQAGIPRLGELLVSRGYATAPDIEQALSLQKALIRTCPKCGKSNNLTTSADADRCASCKEPLEASLPPSSLSLSGAMELPAPAPVPEGPRRLGKYVFQGVLGQGGCGVVYKALDSELNRIVALKLMHRDPGSGAQEGSSEVERFIREARLSARLSHPNIVRVFEAGIIDDLHYIAMECIDGASMAKWRRSGSITIRQQVRVLRDAVLAVHAAHQQGITHRDLKPDNVLVDLRGKVYVMDFGLAKKAGGDLGASITVEGGLMGTPSYMSPEQARGKKNVSRLSDIWSLGIMLYEILCGRTPFKGSTPIETLMHVLKDPIPSLASMAPALMNGTLYRPLEAVCLHALQKEPGDRYTSAKDLAADLTKWLKGDELRVVQRRPAALSRKAVWIGAAAVAVMCIILLAAMPSARPKWTQNLQRAREALARGEPEQAFEIYQGILEKSPGLTEAELGRKQAEDALRIRELEAQVQGRQKEGVPVPLTAPPPGEEYPRSWLLIGDFPNSGLNAVHPPELGIDLRPGVQSWQLFSPAQITGAGGATINLLNRFRKNAHTTAYGLIHVWSPAVTKVRLRVGSDDGGKIWVNEREVYRKEVNRGVVPDQDATEDVTLLQGWNRVLFKVTQSDGAFGFAFRVEGGRNLRYSSHGELSR